MSAILRTPQNSLAIVLGSAFQPSSEFVVMFLLHMIKLTTFLLFLCLYEEHVHIRNIWNIRNVKDE